MSDPNQPLIDGELATLDEIFALIQRRTHGAIRDLKVERTSDALLVSGRTSRFYMKQLATSAVLDEVHLRSLCLQNTIEVSSTS